MINGSISLILKYFNGVYFSCLAPLIPDMVTGNTGKIYLVYINITEHSTRTGSIYFIRTQPGQT